MTRFSGLLLPDLVGFVKNLVTLFKDMICPLDNKQEIEESKNLAAPTSVTTGEGSHTQTLIM